MNNLFNIRGIGSQTFRDHGGLGPYKSFPLLKVDKTLEMLTHLSAQIIHIWVLYAFFFFEKDTKNK